MSLTGKSLLAGQPGATGGVTQPAMARARLASNPVRMTKRAIAVPADGIGVCIEILP